MKKVVIIPVIIAAIAGGTLLAQSNRAVADNNHPADIVGVWEVDAAAPYRPHLFSFHADGTMTSTNPTNVQENVAQPHGGTNDSLGMGVWEVKKQGNDRFIVGTFEELNAFADNHQPTDTLSVSFKVKLGDSNQFDGPALAKLGSDVFPSHLAGVRMQVDTNAVNNL